MLRTFYLLMTALALSVVAPVGQTVQAQQERASLFSKCAKVCVDCQLECDFCFAHCMTLLADGKKEHVKSAQFCSDCSDCCKTCASICARGGPLARIMMHCCAKCCEECAAACEKSPEDKIMAACAKSCRNCGKECSDMIAQLEK